MDGWMGFWSIYFVQQRLRCEDVAQMQISLRLTGSVVKIVRCSCQIDKSVSKVTSYLTIVLWSLKNFNEIPVQFCHNMDMFLVFLNSTYPCPQHQVTESATIERFSFIAEAEFSHKDYGIWLSMQTINRREDTSWGVCFYLLSWPGFHSCFKTLNVSQCCLHW